jgi:D-alanyl-D-alanine carboxypeptidase/D-alanyl-D-alanine-endopeptidase (penicillin-binding protein 4)
MKKISIFITILIIGLLMNPLNAFAKAKLNAQCTFQDSKLNGLNHQDKKFPLASVSKLATTYWALKVLGPQFRYQTIIHIYNRSGNKAEIHIEGGKDPFFGRETSYFLVSELNKMGITQVENLTFDENFKIFWGVRSYDLHIQGRRTEYYYETNEGTRNNIIEVMHDNPINAKYYALTRDKAKSWFGVKMLQKVQFHAKHVQFKSRQDFNNSAANTDAFILKSAPLYRYLKEMNLVSHNYVADMIYAGISNEILGDRSFNAIRYQASVDFEKFLHHDLGLTSKDIDFVNGSGNSDFLKEPRFTIKDLVNRLLKLSLR